MGGFNAAQASRLTGGFRPGFDADDWFATTGTWGLPWRLYTADELWLPNGSDWPNNAAPALGADALNQSIQVLACDDTLREGCGHLMGPIANPGNFTRAYLEIYVRATGAVGANNGVRGIFYVRQIPVDGSAVPAWDAHFKSHTLADHQYWQSLYHDFDLASENINPARLWQWAWYRDGGSGADTLVGDLAVCGIKIWLYKA